ncbi:MAG: cache domain-containing protein [Motiliproteus sp.]|nr:cache domain-containing protein [Motiliproteus sp.]
MKLRIDEQTLPRYQTFGMVALVLILLVGIVGYFLVQNHFANQARLQDLRNQIIDQQLDRTRNEIEATLDYINFQKTQAEVRLKQESKAQIEEVFALVETIYQREHGRRSEGEIKELLREALRNVRFFANRGYFFIIDSQGNGVLNSNNPSHEGRSIIDLEDDQGLQINRNIIHQVNTNPGRSGFLKYRWFEPGSGKMFDKISYFKLFEPFDWIIATGDYIHHFENDIKADTLRRIESLRFDQNGYIAVIRADGEVISSPGWSISQFADTPEEAREMERDAIEAITVAGKQGGGVVRYHWYYPDGRGPVEKISNVVPVPVPGWSWWPVFTLKM